MKSSIVISIEIIYDTQWVLMFSRCGLPGGTMLGWLRKNGRRFEADGTRAKAPVILYAACRCQEVSDVKWASSKTNILVARRRCVGSIISATLFLFSLLADH